MLQEVVRRAGETGIVDASNVWVCFQPLGNGLSVFLLALEAQFQSFETTEKQKRVERSKGISFGVL